LRLVHGDVGQHLAVKRDAGLVQAVDEAAIGEPMDARRRIDALDPQPAEGALLNPAVAIGILACLLDSLASDPDGVLGRP
jgi:hypothetical protein